VPTIQELGHKRIRYHFRKVFRPLVGIAPSNSAPELKQGSREFLIAKAADAYSDLQRVRSRRTCRHPEQIWNWRNVTFARNELTDSDEIESQLLRSATSENYAVQEYSARGFRCGRP
jgi:hypothetical protein